MQESVFIKFFSSNGDGQTEPIHPRIQNGKTITGVVKNITGKIQIISVIIYFFPVIIFRMSVCPLPKPATNRFISAVIPILWRYALPCCTLFVLLCRKIKRPSLVSRDGPEQKLNKTMTHNLLKGKRGIIFGALNAESIAWKVALKAVEEGAQITLSNTPMALRMGTIDELAKQTGATVIPADATSVEDLEKVFKESVDILGGKIDFVLHSIGMSPNVRKHRTYDDLDYGYLQKTLDISAISFHKMLQVAKKQDAIAEYGSVVALTYVASQRTFFGYNDMADAKSMLESIARSFGYIYGREKNVRINTISQSPTPTTAGKGIKDIDNMMDFADKMSPLGNATAEECANYCVMMFSDFTRKVTMQNLFHDGGFSNMGMSLRAMNQYSKDLKPYEDENGKVIYG